MMNSLAHWCGEGSRDRVLPSGLISWMSGTLTARLQQVMPQHEQVVGADDGHRLCDQEDKKSMAFARCFPTTALLTPLCIHIHQWSFLAKSCCSSDGLWLGRAPSHHQSGSEIFEKGDDSCAGS